MLYATEETDESLPGISAWKFDVAENATVTTKTENDTDYVIVTIDGHSRTYKVIIQKKTADWPLGVSVNGTALEDSAWSWQFWDAWENESGKNEVIIYGDEAQFSGTLLFTVAEGKTATYVAGGEDLPDGYIGKLWIKDVDDDDDDAIVFYVKYVRRDSNEDTVDQEEPSDDVDEADQPQESSDFEVQETETTEETTQETATEEVSASVQ